MENNLLIPVPLAQAIANYLATRPFREVAEFMTAMQQLEPATSEAGAAKTKLAAVKE